MGRSFSQKFVIVLEPTLSNLYWILDFIGRNSASQVWDSCSGQQLKELLLMCLLWWLMVNIIFVNVWLLWKLRVDRIFVNMWLLGGWRLIEFLSIYSWVLPTHCLRFFNFSGCFDSKFLGRPSFGQWFHQLASFIISGWRSSNSGIILLIYRLYSGDFW